MGIPILKLWNEKTKQYESVPALTGKQGEPGRTPEKGTDYWTEADKQEVVDSTIDSLPTETWTFTLESGSTIQKKVVVVP